MLVHLVGAHLITYSSGDLFVTSIVQLHASITVGCRQYFMPKRKFLCSMITCATFLFLCIHTGVSPVLLMLYRLRGYRLAYRHCVRVPTLWGRTWTMCR